MFCDRVKRVCLVLLVLACALPCVADELQSSLKHSYQGKAFIIRNFWPGTVLKFDASGQLKGDASSGIWTLHGFIRVEKIEIHGSTLRLRCKRLVIGETRRGFDYSDRQNDARLEIDVDLNSSQPRQEEIKEAFSRMFVNDKVAFRDSVPHYWRPCITTAITGTEKSRTGGCRFSPRLNGIFGVRTDTALATSSAQAPNPPASATAGEETIDGEQIFKVKKGVVSAPKAVYAPDPEYTDEARAGGVSGTCLLELIIDKSGRARGIQIDSPAGYGLDEAAIVAVGNWKFAPATKDGHPVYVKAQVQVSFRE